MRWHWLWRQHLHYPDGTDMNAAMEEVATEVRDRGGLPYIIPGGGSAGLFGYGDELL